MSKTGRGRGPVSFRLGATSLTYFRTVNRQIPNVFETCRCERPSTSTWWRMTWTWSILSILPADLKPHASATRNLDPQVDHFQSGEWITFRAARPIPVRFTAGRATIELALLVQSSRGGTH